MDASLVDANSLTERLIADNNNIVFRMERLQELNSHFMCFIVILKCYMNNKLGLYPVWNVVN